MIVRLYHLAMVRGFSARTGFCRRGARRWFLEHGMDWDAFRRGGIDERALLDTGDPMAIALVKAARDDMERAHGRE